MRSSYVNFFVNDSRPTKMLRRRARHLRAIRRCARRSCRAVADREEDHRLPRRRGQPRSRPLPPSPPARGELERAAAARPWEAVAFGQASVEDGAAVLQEGASDPRARLIRRPSSAMTARSGSAGAARRARPRSGAQLDRNGPGYLFLLPWFIGFFGLTLGPMLTSLYLSLHQFRPADAAALGRRSATMSACFTHDPQFCAVDAGDAAVRRSSRCR